MISRIIKLYPSTQRIAVSYEVLKQRHYRHDPTLLAVLEVVLLYPRRMVLETAKKFLQRPDYFTAALYMQHSGYGTSLLCPWEI